MCVGATKQRTEINIMGTREMLVKKSNKTEIIAIQKEKVVSQ